MTQERSTFVERISLLARAVSDVVVMLTCFLNYTQARTTTTNVEHITTMQSLQIAPAVFTATPHAGVIADQLIKDVDKLITHALAALALQDKSTVRCVQLRTGGTIASPASATAFVKKETIDNPFCCKNDGLTAGDPFDAQPMPSESLRVRVRELLLGHAVDDAGWNALTVEQLLDRGVLRQRNLKTTHARPDAAALPVLFLSALTINETLPSSLFAFVPRLPDLEDETDDIYSSWALCGRDVYTTSNFKMFESVGIRVGTYQGRTLLTPDEALYAVLEYMVKDFDNPATMLAEKLLVDDAASQALMQTRMLAPDLSLAAEFNAYLDDEDFECAGKASDFFRETNPTHRQLRHCVHELSDSIGAEVAPETIAVAEVVLTSPFLPVFHEVVSGDGFLSSLFAQEIVRDMQLSDAVCFSGRRGAEVMNPFWAEDFDISTGCDTALNADGQRFYSSDCRSRFDASDMSFCGGKFPEYERIVRDEMPPFCAANDEQLVTARKLNAIKDALQPLCRRAPSTPETCERAHGTLLRHQGNPVRSLADTHPVRVLRGLWGADNVVFRDGLPVESDSATALQIDLGDIAGHALHFRVSEDGGGSLQLECVALSSIGDCALRPRDWLHGIERSWDWENAFYEKQRGAGEVAHWHCPLQWIAVYAGTDAPSAARVPDGERSRVRFQHITGGRAHPTVGTVRRAEQLHPARFLSENQACLSLFDDVACHGKLRDAVRFNMQIGHFTADDAQNSGAWPWSVVSLLGERCQRVLDWPADKYVLRDELGLLHGSDYPCVVADRVPKFEVVVLRKTPAAIGTRGFAGPGHACRMGRLPRLAAAHPGTQHCSVVGNDLRCVVLASDSAKPLHVEQTATVPPQTIRKDASRARRCGACADQRDGPLLSVGRPLALSPERAMAAWLQRRAGASALPPESWRKGALAQALTTSLQEQSTRGLPDSHADIWSTPWVFCDFELACNGNIAQSEWLADPAPACAAAILASKTNTPQPIHFCLLNAATQALCRSVVQWQEDIASILCKVSGQCATQAFFYTPASYSTENREFVHDTVSRFYTDGGAACPGYSRPYEASDFLTYNVNRNKCSAWAAEEIKELILRVRRVGLKIVDLLYRIVDFILKWFEILVEAFSGIIVHMNSAMRLRRSWDLLLGSMESASVTLYNALFDILFNHMGLLRTFAWFVEQLCLWRQWMIENVVKGFICDIVISIIIPIFNFLGDFVKAFGRSPSWFREANVKLSGWTWCSEPVNMCGLLFSDPDRVVPDNVPLPSATRCWTSYTTFLGDPAQLSCTPADTCAAGVLSPDLMTCAHCPADTATTEQFGCHPLTKTCTCGVPSLRDVPCAVSAECAPLVSESCRYLDGDLSLSAGHVPCDSCEAEPVCLRSPGAAQGVCACPLAHSRVATCEAEDVGSTLAVDEALCVFASEDTLTRTFVIDPAEHSAAPCWLLPHRYCMREASGAGFLSVGMEQRLGAGSRRLLEADTALAATLEPICQDARGGAADLPAVRLACEKKARESARTVAELELGLPECVFCSREDLFAALRRKPTQVLNVAFSPRKALRVAARHTPLASLVNAATVLAGSAHRLIAESPLAVSIVNGSVRVEARKRSWQAAAALAQAAANGLHLAGPASVSNASSENSSHAVFDTNATHPAELKDEHTGERRLLAETLWQRWQASAIDSLAELRGTHRAFSTVVSDVFDYNYLDEKAQQTYVWPPRTVTEADNSCRVLERLVTVAEDTAAAAVAAQTVPPAQPPATLRDAWPALPQAPAQDAVNFAPLTQLVVEGAGAALGAVGVRNAVNGTANVLYAAIGVLRESATCDYHAIQTCSAWRVKLMHGLIIVGSWLLAWVLVCYALNVTFLAVLTSPLFLLGLLQLCYGYSWRCIPMLPTCMLEDYHATLRWLLPRQLTIPPSLRQCDGQPCARACVDVYDFTAWEAPLAWAAADLGLTQALVDALPAAAVLFNTQPLQDELYFRESIARSGSVEDRNAHRICTLWNLHHLLPACVLALALAAVGAEVVRSALDLAASVAVLVLELFAAAAVRVQKRKEEETTQRSD